MRPVAKDFKVRPKGLTSDTAAKWIAKALVEKGSHEFNTGVYRHDTVRVALGADYPTTAGYLTKCAYCESDVTAGSPLRVEHYRPKAKVKEAPSHPGYYWLGYEWSNLLLACETCNGYKGNHFPIAAAESARVGAPPPDFAPPLRPDGTLDADACNATLPLYRDELPLLVNPELEPDTDQHFRFDASGLMYGITQAGAKTVEILHLSDNKRPKLVAARKLLFARCVAAINDAFKEFIKGPLATRNAELSGSIRTALYGLRAHCAKEEAYCSFAQSCWRNLMTFITPYLADPLLVRLVAEKHNQLGTLP